MKFTLREWFLVGVCVALFVLLVLSFLVRTQAPSYGLLSPAVAAQSMDEFRAYQASVRTTYRPLRVQFENILNQTNGTYGVYFEDLQTGANVGVNERAEFVPRSLFKVPTSIAVLKAVEEGNFTLDSTVVLKQDMLDSSFGTLYRKGEGYRVSVRELLEMSLTQSDNTANNALRAIVPFERVQDARLALGLPYPRDNQSVYALSPKSYAAVFRSLYFSSYLLRPYSQYILELLTHSTQADFIQAGLPAGTLLAHKIGEDVMLGQYHDCGIVYQTSRPYILCVMSENATRTEAHDIISQLSKAAFDEASKPAPNLR
jgi:beta-lactamase class A